MKKNNRNRQRKRNDKTAPQLQLGKKINLFNNNTGCKLNVSYPLTVSYSSSTGLFSLNGNTSDIRYLDFSTILNGTAPFSDFLVVYQDYRIKSVSAIVVALPGIETLSTIAIKSLFMTCDPELTGSNPNNTTLITNSSAHIFSPNATTIKSVTFSFPGIGLGSHVWIPTTTAATGTIFFGSQNMGMGGTLTAAYEVFCSLLVEFKNLKTN